MVEGTFNVQLRLVENPRPDEIMLIMTGQYLFRSYAGSNFTKELHVSLPKSVRSFLPTLFGLQIHTEMNTEIVATARILA